MSEQGMQRISEMTDVNFDGVNNPYVPPNELVISDKLALHRDWETEVDPVTYEVIRHGLYGTFGERRIGLFEPAEHHRYHAIAVAVQRGEEEGALVAEGAVEAIAADPSLRDEFVDGGLEITLAPK